ncbi:MAG: hypothetical protein LBN93_09150 [Candidatus Symbiothrix sp.]|jgi:peptidoglycan hydrolase CwlO-like protein|nr:hypothetical protein [Candidatus Symbiothrix sp.]
MTEEQNKELLTLEAQVRQVIVLCENLKRDKAELKRQNAELERQKAELERENKELQMKYDSLKIAKSLAGNEVNFKGAKDGLAKMVKEVDRCIALLSE